MRKNMKSFLGAFSGWGDGRSGGYEDLFNTPFTEKAINKFIGKIVGAAANSRQLTAATLASDLIWVADFAGSINDLYIASDQPAAGESMVYDVQKAPAGSQVFSSILSGTFTLNAASYTSPQTSLFGLIVTRSFNPGDTFRAVRTYTAGGGPVMTGNTVILEGALKAWR